MVRDECDLDLLVFFYRHPRVLLTSEQISTLVGYPMNRVADSIDCFIVSGLLDRTQNAMHAARMYLLKLDGPSGHGPRALLQVASNREGRQHALAAIREAGLPDESNLRQGNPIDNLRFLRIA